MRVEPCIRLSALSAATLLLAACAVSHIPASAYSNPESCADLVDARFADPTAEVDRPPRATRITLGVPERVWNARVSFLVSEKGRAVPESVLISGTAPVQAHEYLRELALAWEFEPARAGECWVPAPSRFEIRNGVTWWGGPEDAHPPTRP
ncbi:MAG: hypothetical protein EA350_12780 [Gemmatimonadales bacterium]|nr:MAG: hypothetical protein EA350_12780 [Gemmatimonadales bacterium]